MDETEASRIRALGELLREFDLDAIRVRLGEAEYELTRREPAPAGAFVLPPAGINGAATAVPAAAGPAEAAADAGPPANVKRVTAPVVGVFYRASSPAAEPFVEIGDRVVPGQVLCILEAMKLMNEITAESSGVVARIVPENGELVSLGDDLVWLAP